MFAEAAADARFRDAECLESEFRKMTPGRSHYRNASQLAWIVGHLDTILWHGILSRWCVIRARCSSGRQSEDSAALCESVE
jgi:hypothetical protein